MPVTMAPQQAAAPVSGGIPFWYGSNKYAEKIPIPTGNTYTLTAAQQEIVFNINPGGFLRGVRLIVRSNGAGALGGGVLSPDAPLSAFANASIENLDGAPILYPMSGYAHGIRQDWSRPWNGEIAQQPGYSGSVNPAFALFLQTEIKDTAAVLANTDARAQFRCRVVLATLAQYVSGGAPTSPGLTITAYMESWAQPDKHDLQDNPISPLPPGMVLANICRHQIINLTAAGADNTLQLSLTGNELRWIAFITRNASQVRANLLSDPIRWRIDTRSLGVFSPDEVALRASDHYSAWGPMQPIPTGVYLWPRFKNNVENGEPWVTTANATYLLWESATAAGGSGGNIEIITDEVTPLGPVGMDYESI